ncbi:MAG: AMP-binding protein, partial [Candidatus Omnitrophota bacterium]
MNLVGVLENSAKRFPWKKCLVSEQGCFSYRVINKKANTLASGLKEKLGIRKGDSVAILLNNCPEYIITLFAILKAGAICVPLNTFLSLEELKYILKDCRAKLLISSSDFFSVLHKIQQEKQGELNSLKNIILQDQNEKGFIYWNTFVYGEPHKNLALNIEPQDTAFLIYTSGTTGFPKGVMLSHHNLCANIISSVQALRVTARDRLLLILPMFHSFTLTVCILIPIFTGAKIILIKSLKPFQKVLRSILLNRVTIIVGIPQLFDIFKNLNLPVFLRKFLRVKICISGAAPLSVETLKIFQDKFKRISLLEGYGLTEASPVVSI